MKSFFILIKTVIFSILCFSFMNQQNQVRISAVFKPKENFKVVNYDKVIDEQIKDVDTLSCSQWKLNSLDIEKVINESKPISVHEWHYIYGHLPCEYQGKLLQGSEEFEFSINAGGWMKIYNKGVSSIILGTHLIANDIYFIDGPLRE